MAEAGDQAIDPVAARAGFIDKMQCSENGTSVWEMNACAEKWKNQESCSRNVHYVAMVKYYPVFFSISNIQDFIFRHK